MNLRSPASRTQYVEECLTLVANINSASMGAMHSTLIDAVNQRLRAAGVPEVTSATNAASQSNAEFDFQTWRITFGAPLMVPGSLQALTLGVNTVYHEARHCEQWFRMAQGVAAGKFNKQVQFRIDGSSAASIAGGMWIPQNIAQLAMNNSDLGGNTDRDVLGWWNSVYAESGGIRGRKLGHIQQRYDAYRNLPEEVDAWFLGDSVEEEFKKSCPKLGCPSYAFWKSETKWSFHSRSSELKAVDKALEDYEKSKSADDRGKLKKAFDPWYNSKLAKGGSKRATGPDNVIEQLKTFLDQFNDEGAEAQGVKLFGGKQNNELLAAIAKRKVV